MLRSSPFLLKKTVQFTEGVTGLISLTWTVCRWTEKIAVVSLFLVLDRLPDGFTALPIGVGVIKPAVQTYMQIPAAGGTFIPDMDLGFNNLFSAEAAGHS